jgi:hypothetical protein
MIVEASLAPLRKIKMHEYATRFLFGGICTMTAGIIATHFGPRIGGLFLAFPAIFPAGASLIEQHEIAHKEEAGFNGQSRGRRMAGVDAAGAGLGCVGLAAFAAVVWKALPAHGPSAVIASATICWFVLSVLLWLLRKSRLLRRKATRGSAPA